MSEPSLKRSNWKRPSFYIFLSFYVFLIALILVESAMPGSASGTQSNWFSQIVATVLNWFSEDTPAVIVEPLSVSINSDSSFLGAGNVATGTTTLLEFTIEEPSYVKGETCSREFRYEELSGGDNFEVITQSYSSATYARIVAKGEPLENCAVRFYAGTTNDIYCDYYFNIVELATPNEDGYTISCTDTELNIGESEIIDVTFSYENRSDDYLRRYWDPTKLSFSSSDESVATVDEFGCILAKGEGSAVISCGTQAIEINVSADEVEIGDSLSITSSGTISENDYDVLGNYVSANNVTTIEAAQSINSGIVLSAEIDGIEDSGAAYSWEVVDENGDVDYLGGKIVPLNDNGSQVRLMGYRKGPGEIVYAKCIVKRLNEDDLTLTQSFTVLEILPATMAISGNQSVISSGYDNQSTIALSGYYTSKHFTLEASFLGDNSNTNVTNKKIVVSEYDESAFTVAGNSSTAITLTFMSKGTHTIKVSSEANPSLYYILSFTVEETPNVDGSSSAFRGFVRKFFGHASLFLVTAIFGFLFFSLLWENKKMSLSISAACSLTVGFIVAGSSELIQKFTDDRGPSWTDVGIDMIGYAIGTLIVFLVLWVIKLHRKKKTSKENNQIQG